MPTVTREFLHDLYWKQWLSTRQIAKIVGKCQATVRKMMLKSDIPLRSNRDWLRVKIEPHVLRTLYWDKKMTIPQIAEKFGVSTWTIHQRMIKFNIPRRKIGETNLKQQKLPFSGELTEMNYLRGLRAGDFSVRWKGKRVRVEVCTSHPAMIELFKNLFQKYANVGLCPESKHTGVFLWRVFADLDASFSFLVEKPKFLDSETLFSEDMFLAFLAGYTDAEGSIIVSPNRDQIVFCFRICSEDFSLLKGIYKKLCETGYHPRLVLDKEKGTNGGFSKLNADYWRLELCKKDEVVRLVQQLPMKHSERKRKRDLMLGIKSQTCWREVRDKVLDLKSEIEREVKACVQEAALAYHKKHIPSTLTNNGNHEKTSEVLEKTSRREGSVHFMSQTLCYRSQ